MSELTSTVLGHQELHRQGENHHHHSHASHSHHVDGKHLLNVNGLSIGFRMYDPAESFWRARPRMSWVIRDLSISVHVGEIVAVVGASGSGKTLLADSIMGMFESNSEVVGEIYFDGEAQTPELLQELRGKEIAYIPQSVNALDPLMKVGVQIGGTLEQRKELYAQYRLDASIDGLFPHELSGGMARRVFLCMARMTQPQLIVADEPTPGLDLPLAKKALQDFRDFANGGGGVLLITHDIELALEVADRIAVFKDGTVIEETSVESFSAPELLEHPFARSLWHALPEHGFEVRVQEEQVSAGDRG